MFVTKQFFGRNPKSLLFSEGTFSCTQTFPIDSICLVDTNPCGFEDIRFGLSSHPERVKFISCVIKLLVF